MKSGVLDRAGRISSVVGIVGDKAQAIKGRFAEQMSSIKDTLAGKAAEVSAAAASGISALVDADQQVFRRSAVAPRTLECIAAIKPEDVPERVLAVLTGSSQAPEVEAPVLSSPRESSGRVTPSSPRSAAVDLLSGLASSPDGNPSPKPEVEEQVPLSPRAASPVSRVVLSKSPQPGTRQTIGGIVDNKALSFAMALQATPVVTLAPASPVAQPQPQPQTLTPFKSTPPPSRIARPTTAAVTRSTSSRPSPKPALTRSVSRSKRAPVDV